MNVPYNPTVFKIVLFKGNWVLGSTPAGYRQQKDSIKNQRNAQSFRNLSKNDCGTMLGSFEWFLFLILFDPSSTLRITRELINQ